MAGPRGVTTILNPYTLSFQCSETIRDAGEGEAFKALGYALTSLNSLKFL